MRKATEKTEKMEKMEMFSTNRTARDDDALEGCEIGSRSLQREEDCGHRQLPNDAIN
jgi:hypothetical protein